MVGEVELTSIMQGISHRLESVKRTPDPIWFVLVKALPAWAFTDILLKELLEEITSKNIQYLMQARWKAVLDDVNKRLIVVLQQKGDNHVRRISLLDTKAMPLAKLLPHIDRLKVDEGGVTYPDLVKSVARYDL